MLIVGLFACKQDGASHSRPQETGERPIPEAQAVLNAHWYSLPELQYGYLWPSFATPAPDEPLFPSIDTCASSDPLGDAWYREPVLLDVGEIVVRIGERIVPEDWGEKVTLTTEYPAGEPVWFEVTGGVDLPGFAVPELVELPQPAEQFSVSLSSDGVRAEWLPSSGSDVVVVVGSTEGVAYCRVQDDGEFVVPTETLPEDAVSVTITRLREGEFTEGDVLVKGIASHTIALPLGGP